MSEKNPLPWLYFIDVRARSKLEFLCQSQTGWRPVKSKIAAVTEASTGNRSWKEDAVGRGSGIVDRFFWPVWNRLPPL
jgi:hypothetical protein